MLTYDERRHTALHEAGHALGFLWGDYKIDHIVVDDETEEHVHGCVHLDWDHFEAKGVTIDYCTALAMGALACGNAPPHWTTLDEDYGLLSDGRQMARAVRMLGLNRFAYQSALAVGEYLLTLPDFRAGHSLLARALTQVPQISGTQLEVLLGGHVARIRGEDACFEKN